MYKNFKNLSDNELALKLQDTYDPVIFNELLGRYMNKILKQCRLLVKNSDTAEDLTQEILIKIFMKINSFKANSQFSTWVYTITHHTCIDFIRKNKRNLYQQLTAELAEAIEEEQNTDEPLDFSFEKFNKMLEEMEPETKTILILKYQQNLSIKEMQDQLKIGESAIKMRLLRARERMRKYFE
jgi:RNA polymerase sigma factor (sigma-70 family)